MQIQFDKIKHTAGVIAVGAIPLVMSYVHAPYEKPAVIVLAVVAFLCGALSPQLFISNVQAAVLLAAKKKEASQ